ncbi:MAG TPA: GNAT family N-acetyltransferase [Actinophytocola sp.]|uniref:GNAT family N-acetyltransferase n=1 Tax=Actinophytocola sp. TaxID=1872138 RepID=UPI002DDD96B9|nr:GNAT family N-acetyltransferase [Actinophytocola sp.]HEV2778671.1 GNAT family N-acetyltransferase [Actinophytocola sp.]
MEVRVHTDPPEFWALARPIFAADPMRHTHGLSVIRRLVDAPNPDDEPATLLTLWDGDRIAGAAFRTPPWPVCVSAVPAEAMEATASALLELDPDLPGVSGPRDAAEPFAEMWAKLTGAAVKELVAMRLYRLGRLEPPAVPGHARLAMEEDLPLLGTWTREFQIEALGREREPGRSEANVRRSLGLGNGWMLWEHDGRIVSVAHASAPVDGMSRVGPVYTPPELRGRGYGSAATAAVSRWALDAGAEYVILFTDLANPVSNSIYQRLGYRPVYDQTELEFDR